MIPVDRSRVKAPARLLEMAEQKLPELERYFADVKQTKMVRVYPADTSADAVMPELVELFHEKCAWCESLVQNIAEVSHFRPRRNAAGLDASDVDAQHYWWIAYAWENLYLSCPVCKQHKRNLFPTLGERASVGTVGKDLDVEDRLLVDPCADDPAQSLRFDPSGTVEALDELGQVSIHVFGLNREELQSTRQKVYRSVELLFQSLDETPANREPLEMTVGDDMFHAGVARQAWFDLGIDEKLGRPWEPDEGEAEPRTRAAKQVVVERVARVKAAAEKLQAVWVDEIEIHNFRSIHDCRMAFATPERPDAAVEPIADAADAVSRLERFKHVRSVEVDRGEHALEFVGQPWLMLIGQNGVGKSSLLKAIALALATPKDAKRWFPDAAQCVNRVAAKQDGDTDGYVRVKLSNGETRAVRFREGDPEFTFEGELPASVQAVGYSSTRLPAGHGRTPRDTRSRVVMDNLFNPFIPLSDADRWLADEERISDEDFPVLAEGLASLLSLEGNDGLYREGGALYAHVGGDEAPVEQMSDGYRSVVGVATDLMRRLSLGGLSMKNAVGTVLLDEIEVHLHPEWKIKIVDTLRRVFPGLRFVVATHDPLCLRGLGPGEVHRIYRDPETKRPVLSQMDVPPGLHADELLTGAWFGLSTTLDRDTEALIEEHQRLLREGDPESKERLDEIQAELRRRSSSFPATSLERMIADIAADEMDREFKEFTPDERTELRSRIEARLANKREDGDA